MYTLLKRCLDLLLSLIAVILLSPLFLVVMVVLRLSGEGEIFFRQRRIGHKNKPFDLLKFATMLKNSPSSGTITVAGDPRILPVGRFLRKSKINELPQLLNVLKGDMSLVGPRPLTTETFGYYSEALQPLIYRCKPGLTGMGSLVFRNEEEILRATDKDRTTCYREDIAPLKGALEVWYHDHRSIFQDLKIILFTAVAVVSPGSKRYGKWFAELPSLDAGPSGSAQSQPE
jgi:lipopolysaccharide/colanic/teichoic acid biosynthesis glycosyltransferase